MVSENRKIWVVFTGKNSLWYLQFLKKEFRHCFAILEDKDHWITIDPLSSHTEITLIAKTDTGKNLAEWFKESGFIVVEAEFLDHQSHTAPLAFINCVEVIKRILGIHKFFLFTPYQLFKFINKRKDINHGKYI